MSDTDKNISENYDSTWFVRTGGDDIYGPVDLYELRQWAEQGRIEPENEISTDCDNWIAASDLPELEMNWTAELNDKTTFGPFNFHLTNELVRRGIISTETTITNRKTGEIHHMSESYNTDTAQNDIPDDDSPGTDREETQTDHQSAEPDESPKPANSDSSRDEENTQTSERLKTMHQISTDIRTQLAETRKKLTKQRAINTAMQDNISKLQEDLRNTEAEKESIRTQMVELQDQLAESLSEVENRNAQLQQLQEHYERIQIENQNQFEALDELRAEAMEREREFQKKLSRESEKSRAKTATLMQVMQVASKDEDIETGNIPEELLETGDSEQIAELQSKVNNLRQQVEIERNHAKQMEKLARIPDNKESQKTLTGLLLAILIGIAVIIIITLINSNRTGTPQTTAPPPAKHSVSSKSTVSAGAGPASSAGTSRTTNPPVPHPAAEAVTVSENLNLPPDDNSTAPSKKSVAINWPEINLPRSKITHNYKYLRIVFRYGIFSRETTISPNAKIDLANLARQLQDRINEFTIIAEGHTDSTPIRSPQALHVNNFALGMARAEAVKKFMETKCNIPKGVIKTASAGESDPPYPNTDSVSRQKNRTVVLKLVPRHRAG